MNQANADFFPWNEQVAKDEWYAGIYRVRIVHAEDGNSQTSGKRMPRIGFQCIEPVEFNYLSHFENYVVGSDEAPGAIIEGTMGHRSLMKLLLAAQAPPANSLAGLLASLKGAELLIAMSYKPTAEFVNNITAYFRLGERPVSVQVPVGAGAPTAAPGTAPTAPGPMTAPPVSTPGPAVAPGPVAQPSVATPPAPPAPPAPPQEVSTSAPVGGTSTAPGGAPPPPGTPAPAGDIPSMVPCSMCAAAGKGNVMVPYLEFGSHVQAHANGTIT